MKEVGTLWNRAWSIAMAAGFAFSSAAYFVLRDMTEQLKATRLADRFEFISFAKKYAPLSEHPEAFTVAIAMALTAALVLGTVIGCLLEINHQGMQRFTERSPLLIKLLAAICLPGLIFLPLIPLAPYDGRLPHDRLTAGILSSDLSSALFVGVLHSGYLVFFMLCVLFVRHFFRRS